MLGRADARVGDRHPACVATVRPARRTYAPRGRARGRTVRTRIRDDLHALARPGGVAAVAAAGGGLLALRAPGSTAWALVATVNALGTSDEGTVAVLTAAEVTRVAWAAWVLGGVVVLVALMVALDRPPPAAEAVLLAAAVGMVAVAVSVLVARPSPVDFAAHGRARDLVGDTASLPTGIEIALTVEPTAGPVLLGVGALIVVVGTVLATRRG